MRLGGSAICSFIVVLLQDAAVHVQGQLNERSGAGAAKQPVYAGQVASDETTYIQTNYLVDKDSQTPAKFAEEPVGAYTIVTPPNVEGAAEAWGGIDGVPHDEAEALKEMGAHPFWHMEMNQLHAASVCFCCAVLSISGILCAAGGIGGGGIYVTVLMVVGKLELLDAVPLSQAIVFLGSISTMFLNMMKAQGSLREARALIDYDLCRVVVPLSLSGTFLGVILNRHLPGWLTLSVLTGVLIFITVSMVRETMQQYLAECKSAPGKDGMRDSPGASSPIPSTGTTPPAATETAPNPVVHESRHALAWWDVAVLTFMLSVVIAAGMLRFHTSRCARSPMKLRGEYCNHRAIFWWGDGTLEHLVFTRSYAEHIAVIAMAVPLLTCALVGTSYSIALMKHGGWQLKGIVVYGGMALCTGILSGLLGIGGGLIFSPFFLLMGQLPSVAVASSSTCVLITSSSTALQYLFTDRVIMSLTILYGAINLMASYVGTKLVHWLQDKMKARKSIISGIVAFGVLISTVLALVKLWPKLDARFGPLTIMQLSPTKRGDVVKTLAPMPSS